MPEHAEASHAYPYVVVIPTVADPGVLVPTVRRIVQHQPTTGALHLVLVVNSDRPHLAAEAVGMIDAMRPHLARGSRLSVIHLSGPAGFGGACNAGIRYALESGGAGGVLTVILNDDVRVTPGWLDVLGKAPTARYVCSPGEPMGEDGNPHRHDARLYGRIGLVGPASDNVAGLQAIQERVPLQHLDAYAVSRHEAADTVLALDFLSGFCVGLTPEALRELMLTVDGEACLFDPVFGVGGFEDNDLCVRAELAGWRCAMALGCYVHHVAHQTLDRIAPEANRGLAQRFKYYRKWAGHPGVSGRRVIATYRVRLETVSELTYWKQSLRRWGALGDGVAVLLTGDPALLRSAHDWHTAPSILEDEDAILLDATIDLPAGSEAARLRLASAAAAWVRVQLERGAGARSQDVTVDTWSGEWNERNERNHAIGLAEKLGADWIFSLDADEVIEQRVTRAHLDRLMSHPDPMVRAWDVSWLNHWDSPRLVRHDRPWGDGGTYTTAMHGYRLFRVCKASPRRILAGTANGLHCGNVPDHDPAAKRVAGLRIRHLGYLQPADRQRKFDRYQKLDPNPDAVLTGGGYGHLVNEERMMLSPFVAEDGIGFTCLTHAEGQEHEIARHLDVLHGLVDEVSVVWTGAGVPHQGLLSMLAAFGGGLVVEPWRDDFARARNAGLAELRRIKAAANGERRPSLGWALTLDPDEIIPNPLETCMAIRRMAETSDAYGWLFQFDNLAPTDANRPPSRSETVRMVRLDPQGIMRYSGRVHENYDDALRQLRAGGVLPTFRLAPFVLVNPGLAGDDATMERKLRRYQNLLVLEVTDRPDNAGAWTSLGLQYANDGLIEKARECYRRALVADPTCFIATKELATDYMRQARVLTDACLAALPSAHPMRKVVEAQAQMLGQFAPDQPILGLARAGVTPENADVPLPPFDEARFVSRDSGNAGTDGVVR